VNNFYKRAITGTIFVVVLILSLLTHEYSFFIFFLLLTVGAVNEFYQLSEKAGAVPQKFMGSIAAISIFTSAFVHVFYNYQKLYLISGLLVALIFICELYRKKKHPFKNISWTITGLIYTTIPFALLNYIVFLNQGEFKPELLACIFLLIWTNDTFAYIFGVSFGKHRLFERISPKKSWEGSIGGGLSTIGIGVLLSYYPGLLDMTDWIVIAIITVVTGTLGDLTESLFKRSINIKDSGNILPGHGGILDRFDALLLAIPFIFVYLSFKY
jgi:phosphatidate cytidylyltransferase